MIQWPDKIDLTRFNMETLPSSEKLMKDLISTLEKEITDLEKALTEISFIIKAKKAKLRKYKTLSDDVQGTV